MCGRALQWGPFGQRNQDAEAALTQNILPRAHAQHIQIWALGFGPQASESALEKYSQGGAGGNSACPGRVNTQPRARVVRTPQDVVGALLLALGYTHCGAPSSSGAGSVGPAGEPLTLHLTVPAIASDVAITVIKNDPNFQVASRSAEQPAERLRRERLWGAVGNKRPRATVEALP